MEEWAENSKHILSELKRLDNSVTTLNQSIGYLRVEVAKLKTKSTIWGAISGGFISLIITFLINK